MPQQGRELRPTESHPAEKPWVYSLEQIIALQKALENGISDLVANSPELLPGTGTSFNPIRHSEVAAAQQSAAATLVTSPATSPLWFRFLSMVCPESLLAWIMGKLSRRHRSVQSGA